MIEAPRSIPDPLRQRYLAEGHWTDESLGGLLAEGLAAAPDNAFVIHSEVRPWRGTFGDVLNLARRVAGGLRARGVGVGDLVAFQTPNWVEGAVTFYAIGLLGAVPVPIVHFYGPKEVGFILRQSGARVLITADRFRSQDFLANLDTLRDGLTDLETIVAIGDDVPAWALRFGDLVDAEPVDEPARVDPETPSLIAYTSGTTADPKGVVHAHRTIVGDIRQWRKTRPDDWPPQLVGAPIGHGIGMIAALLTPIYGGWPIHLIDQWDPERVLEVMLEEQVGAGAGSTYFLTSLLDHPDLTPEHLHLMRYVGLGGSPIPAAVSERATDLGISIVRSYGSTEHPSTTGSTHDDPLEKRLYTDGKPLSGVELRLLDEDGNEVGPGEPGEILSRGPDLCLGYTDPVITAETFTADGWYRTGDVGIVDEDGYLQITDRVKDIIIRGGENVSAAEVEEQLARIDGVAEVAVVAAPDERLGEHGCAFFRLRDGAQPFDLAAVREHLTGSGLAKQKWPEELRFIEEFPRTASGKIQKYALREQVRSGE